ncbi:MAG: YlxR family protein [Clostridia bacterium]
MNNPKNTRMCLMCRKRQEKTNYIRLIANNNNVVIDKTNNSQCRSVYICNLADCIDKLKKRKNIENMFKIALKNKEIMMSESNVNELIEKIKRG